MRKPHVRLGGRVRSWLRLLVVALGCSVAVPSGVSQPIIINHGAADLGPPEEIIDPEATGFWLVPMAARLDVVLPRPIFRDAVGIDTSVFLGPPMDAELLAMAVPFAENQVPMTSPLIAQLPTEGKLSVWPVRFEAPTAAPAPKEPPAGIVGTVKFEARPTLSVMPAEVQPLFQIETEAAYYERLKQEARQRAQPAPRTQPLTYPPLRYTPMELRPQTYVVAQPVPSVGRQVFDILSWPLRQLPVLIRRQQGNFSSLWF